MHKRYLSLTCAATVLGHRTKRNDYIKNLVEVNYLCLVLSLKGLENAACVLLRQTIELTLKHIYFSTHPVEYEWARTKVGYRDLTFQFLLEYLSRTNEIKRLSGGEQVVKDIDENFGLLSRHVHVHSRKYMGFSNISKAYRTNQRVINKINQLTKPVWSLSILTLLVFFKIKFLKASSTEKDLIRFALSKLHKKSFDSYLISF